MLLTMSSLLSYSTIGQETVKTDSVVKTVEAPKVPSVKWYEALAIRGYAQVRYNRLLETNEDLGCEQCDKSWGKNGGFFIRRARLILFGNVHEKYFLFLAFYQLFLLILKHNL